VSSLKSHKKAKRIIKRDVVRVVTPGTLFENRRERTDLVALFPEKETRWAALSGAYHTASSSWPRTTWADLPGLFGKASSLKRSSQKPESNSIRMDTRASSSPNGREKNLAVETTLGHLSQSFGRGAVEALAVKSTLTHRRWRTPRLCERNPNKRSCRISRLHNRTAAKTSFSSIPNTTNLELVENNPRRGRKKVRSFPCSNITVTRDGQATPEELAPPPSPPRSKKSINGRRRSPNLLLNTTCVLSCGRYSPASRPRTADLAYHLSHSQSTGPGGIASLARSTARLARTALFIYGSPPSCAS